MYGIFTYIWLKFMVCKYFIHGAYGIYTLHTPLGIQCHVTHGLCLSKAPKLPKKAKIEERRKVRFGITSGIRGLMVYQLMDTYFAIYIDTHVSQVAWLDVLFIKCFSYDIYIYRGAVFQKNAVILIQWIFLVFCV